ncbi:lysozyme [Caenibius sp. WL]|uniref:lysozyme n=1 Tax=Caenibius sp. WL TaxID=2872646 RepID=UPI001C99D209|nr:lysozyme [Caenibius sp. WL]QZP06785.1 lysozyme [Caenibius sp. WL]
MGLLDYFTRRPDGRAEPVSPPPIEPLAPTAERKPGKVTLAVIVGAGVAAALGQFIPTEESGRKVEASVGRDGTLQVRHISGKQYLRAYLDIVGVATACDGITTYRGKPIKAGQQFTEAQCAAMLEEELIAHAQGVMKCTPGLALSSNPTIERRREGPRFAAVSLAYNVGVRRYCGSTGASRFNAGAYDSGCEALTWWNKAGGRVVKGLVARRERERRVCIGGLRVLK